MAMDALSRYLLTDKPEDDGVSVDDIGTYEDTTTQPELMRAISRDANASKRAFTQTPAYTLEQLFAGETEPGVVPAKGEAFAPATMRPPHRFPKLRSLGEGVTAPLEAPSETMDIPVLPPEMPGALKAPTMAPPKMGETRESLGAMLGGGRLTSPIPVASVPVQRDAAAPTTGVIAPTTGARAAEGAGGDTDEMDRLSSAANWIRAMETAGSAISGKNLRSGIADSLADRMKQVEALRAKREEKGLLDTQEMANNKAQVDYLISRFPEQKESLTNLYGMTKRPNFAQLVRLEEQIALDKAKRGDIGAKAEDRAKTQEYRAGVLGLRRDTLEENKAWRAVQAGLKQSELDLRQAENERKATGSAEPSEKERSVFQASMKPAEKTAVALRDADTLNSLGEGMLVSGKPPAFLSRSDIAAFNGVPLGDVSRSQLAQSNPQAYDLLTKMAEIKTIIGHDYFGSALSPSEAERQRQFMDFSSFDSPESIAKKMKNYHDTLNNAASVFLRPRVVGRPLGAEWVQATRLDAITGEGGTFAGLFAEANKQAPKSGAVKAPAAATPAPAPAVGEKVRMIAPDGRRAGIPAAEVEARKAQGWKEAP